MTTNNPFLLIDEKIEAEAHKTARGDLTKATKMIEESNKALDAVAAELGDTSESINFANITSISGDAGEKVEKIVELHSKLGGAVKAQNELRAMAKSKDWRERLLDGTAGTELPATDGGPRHFAEAMQRAGHPFKFRKQEGWGYDLPLPAATLFKTSDGWAPEVDRTGYVRLAEQWMPTMMSLFGTPIQYNQHAITYMIETITTDASAVEGEGDAGAESDLSYAPKTEAFETIRAHLPVSEEQLQDEPMIQAFLSRRLMYLAERKADENFYAEIAKAANSTETQKSAKTGAAWWPLDPIGDIRSLMAKIHRDGEAPVSGIGISPLLWARIQQQKTSDGWFIVGNPFNTSDQNRLWGRPVIEAHSATAPGAQVKAATLGVMGDFISAADIYYRQAARVDVGLNDDDFTRFQITLRVSLRAKAAVYRPASFGRLLSADA